MKSLVSFLFLNVFVAATMLAASSPPSSLSIAQNISMFQSGNLNLSAIPSVVNQNGYQQQWQWQSNFTFPVNSSGGPPFCIPNDFQWSSPDISSFLANLENLLRDLHCDLSAPPD